VKEEQTMSVLRFLIVLSVTIPVCADEPETPSAEASDKYTLRYRFPEGESLHYLLHEKSNHLQQYEGGEQRSENDSSLEKQYRIVETRDDGSAVLEVVTEYVKLKYSFADAEPVEYDSRSGTAPPEPLKSLRNKVGKPVARAEFSARGELLSLTELSDGAVPVEQADLGRKNFLVELPRDEIAIGESWKQTFELKLWQSASPVQRTFTVSHLYKLRNVENGKAEITFTTLISPRLLSPELRAKMIQELPSGTIVFDLEEGRILSQIRRVERTELGVGGPKTAMSVESVKVEKLIDKKQTVSQAAP
jgi:hypothetical protein